MTTTPFVDITATPHNSPAEKAMVLVRVSSLPVVDVLRLIEQATQLSDDEAWQAACGCLADLVIDRATEDLGAPF